MAGKSVPVSPLAPKSFARAAADSGRAVRHGGGGYQICGAAPMCCSLFSTRAPRPLASSRARNAHPPQWTGAAKISPPVVSSPVRGGFTAHIRHVHLVVNSGNANAFTGRKGREAVKPRPHALPPRPPPACTNEVYLASTGVIGEPLDASANLPTVLDDCAEKKHADATVD